MSHPLYDDDEQVTCMCTKCGWLGTTTAPMFGCGGCKKYLARPMDLTDRKLKAAEAQVAQLQARVAELEEDNEVLSQIVVLVGRLLRQVNPCWGVDRSVLIEDEALDTLKTLRDLYEARAALQQEHRPPLKDGHEHLTIEDQFRSDKYPWCRDGFIPLKQTDPMCQDLLLEYARRRTSVDQSFSDDLLAALQQEPSDG